MNRMFGGMILFYLQFQPRHKGLVGFVHIEGLDV